MTVQDCLDFIRENDHKKVFEGWTEIDIAGEILRSIDEDTFFWDSHDNKLQGIAICKAFHHEKRIHVVALLLSPQSKLRYFFKRFEQLYPDYTLSGNRRNNKLVFYRRFKGIWENKTLKHHKNPLHQF